jgi:protein XagA
MGRRLLPTTLLAAAPVWLAGSGEAVAAAWTLSAGGGQAIVGGAFLKGDRYFDARGKLIPEAAYRKFDLPILLEYGLTDRITLIAAPSGLNVSVATEPASRYGGAGYTDLGARVRVWASDTDVVSLQATTRLPGARDAANPATVG